MRSVLLLLLVTGCAPEEPALDAAAWVTRASLDLRGVRPTLDEIRAVQAQPARAAAMVDGFLDDPRFGDRVADHYAELLHTRTELWPTGPEQLGVDVPYPDYVRDVGDEPLRVLSRVATEDLPWTEVVLGDWTMATPLLASIWPLDREDGEGWQVARYIDGRPAAGLLSSTALWWRYGSTPSNGNRGRAAQVSRLFLCIDYSNVTVPFDPELDLLDEEAVQQAIRTDPSCTSCHDSLDPIAGYLYGFWWFDPNSPVEITRYWPGRELLWDDYSGLPPALDEVEGFTLRDLGRQIAGDRRFVDCAVDQAWEALVRQRPSADDVDVRHGLSERFIRRDLRLRSLWRDVVHTDAYRSLGEDGSPRKLVPPELLASQVEDLTGFRLATAEGWDLLTADLAGLRGLAGGADGATAARNADTPNATVLLVQERLAEAAATFVVRHDLEVPPAERRLFHRIEPNLPAGDDARGQIVDLLARILGVDTAEDGPAVDAYLALWADLREVVDDDATAWAGVVTAMLRDPDFLLY